MSKAKIGIRPIIDGRRFGVRESLEEQTMSMVQSAVKLITENVFYADGTPVECVIGETSIGGSAEAARVADQFSKENVVATLSVTPCWCYGSETMDMDPNTIKAVWGFNGTERPGAVYLAAVMAAHAQRGLPAFSIYGHDVQDMGETEVPDDVKEKILRFARCAVAVGQMKGKSYVNIGSVSMGIMGSYCDADFFQKYLGIRAEWVDMTEVLRREKLGIYDPEEYEIALKWTKEKCKEGFDKNPENIRHNEEQKKAEWEFVVKMTLIIKDILVGNPKLKDIGWIEEANGRNAIAGGFQGQRMWSDWLPNGDFSEAILNTSFDWSGKKQPNIVATENDGLNAVSMLLTHLLTNSASIFADVRTYWSPESIERVSGWKPKGKAANGFIHLINSGAAALDGSGVSKDDNGNSVMKKWWEMNDKDIEACTDATNWCPADLGYFRGGGFSSQFTTKTEMPVTLIRMNLVDGLGPMLQFFEGYTVNLPEEVDNVLYKRTDPTWPSTWFAPIIRDNAATDVYSVMANWGSNHGSFCYGHIGADLITLASMLRIPVSLHNVEDEKLFRPHAWAAFGTKDKEAADYKACETYGAIYK